MPGVSWSSPSQMHILANGHYSTAACPFVGMCARVRQTPPGSGHLLGRPRPCHGVHLHLKEFKDGDKNFWEISKLVTAAAVKYRVILQLFCWFRFGLLLLSCYANLGPGKIRQTEHYLSNSYTKPKSRS